MDMHELDEAEKKRRKADVVAWREKKRFSSMFMFLASLFEIAETLIIIIALFLLDSIFFLKVLNTESLVVQKVFQTSLVIFFLAGIIIGFFIYKKVIGIVIKKFNLKDRLSDEVLFHYLKKSKEETQEELKK